MEDEQVNSHANIEGPSNRGAELLSEILKQAEGDMPSGGKEAYIFALDAMYAYFKTQYEDLRDSLRDPDSRMSDDEYMAKQEDIQKDRDATYKVILEKYPPSATKDKT